MGQVEFFDDGLLIVPGKLSLHPVTGDVVVGSPFFHMNLQKGPWVQPTGLLSII